MKRVATALLGIPLVVAGISLAPWWVTPAAVALLGVLGYHEYRRLAEATGVRALPLAGTVFTAIAVVSPLLGPGMSAEVLLAALLAVLIVVVLEPGPLEKALATAGATLLGVAWIGLLLSYFVALNRRAPADLYLLLGAVWAGDSGAYYAGRAFGKRKLLVRVSPGKTVEGAIGGLVACVAAVAVWRALGGAAGAGLGTAHVAPLALLVTVFGVLGDLAESAVKRGAGAKDSGTLLPGHGGVLDRLDSLLFAAPVVYHYLSWARAGFPPSQLLP